MIRILSEIYEPLIEQEDAEKLAIWDPAMRAERLIGHGMSIEATKRYYQLLDRIAVVLQTHNGNEKVARALINIRDFQAEVRVRYPQMDWIEEQVSMPVSMLLTKGDWLFQIEPDGFGIGFQPIKGKVEQNMFWVAFMPEPWSHRIVEGKWVKQLVIVLASINLEKKNLTALWQTGISISDDPRFAKLTGVVVNEGVTYLAVEDLGLVEFPGTSMKGREILENPKVLTREHGLPSVLITAIAKDGNKLWVAYGGTGQESGLGLYDPQKRNWETVFCSTLKGKPPFNAGQPYVMCSLTRVPPDKLFFLAYDPELSRQDRREVMLGLWELNSNTRVLKRLAPISFTRERINVEDFENKLWFKTPECLMEFVPASRNMKLLLGRVFYTLPKQYLEKKYFTSGHLRGLSFPETSIEGVRFGVHIAGYCDLSTATIHNNRLWARLGRHQLIVTRKDKSLEEAE
ncbi:hypothetical protein KA005_55685, partial [bacterium]|nr:hypothetical protein [bacterium]